MNNYYTKREIDDFSDAPEYYPQSKKGDVLGALLLVAVTFLFILLAVCLQYHGS